MGLSTERVEKGNQRMVDSQDWMTPERVQSDREILQGVVADVKASGDDPALAKLCADTLAGGHSLHIVKLAGLVRAIRAIRAQQKWEREHSAAKSQGEEGAGKDVS